MSVQPLSFPIYEITCPTCNKCFLQPISKVVTENFADCPSCHERIDAEVYYQRSKVIELMKKVGYTEHEKFISVND